MILAEEQNCHISVEYLAKELFCGDWHETCNNSGCMSYVKDLFSCMTLKRELEQTRQRITAVYQSLINFPTGT
jgi:hypothetical protein